MGILPLGTGNDLARVLGWGGGFNNDLISELLLQTLEAHPAVLDRWEVCITPKDPRAPPPSPKKGKRRLPDSEYNKVTEFEDASGAATERVGRRTSRLGRSSNANGGGGDAGAVAPSSDAGSRRSAHEPSHERERVAPKELVFQNYLGIGVDAQAALRFHRTRNISPHLFFSAFTVAQLCPRGLRGSLVARWRKNAGHQAAGGCI